MDRGFTLIELMIVVGIIGLLSSLAIPNYLRFTARTKRSEMFETVSKLKLQFKNSYDNTGSFKTSGTLAASPVNPSAAVPVGQGANWDTQAPGWTEFQFAPEGAVKMRYWYTLGSADPITGAVSDVTIFVCGSFAGVGYVAAACPSDMTGTANYSYTEVFHGNGSSDRAVEWPPGLF